MDAAAFLGALVGVAQGLRAGGGADAARGRWRGQTRKQIVLYMIALLLGSLTLFAIGTLGWFYLAVALLSGGTLLYYAIRLTRTRTLADARAFFWFSNYYLALLFAAMVIDHLWH